MAKLLRSASPSLSALMTRERRIEVGRIVLTGVIVLLYWQSWVPLPVLWVAVAIGLYPLVKTGLVDLVHDHKIGTEIFVTVATLVAVLGGETIAGAVLMVVILIAEFIAGLNTDRARASIKALIGSVPQVALDAAFSEAELVQLAAAADRRSAHPLAKAVVDYAAGHSLTIAEPERYEQLQARGVTATVAGHMVLVGNPALLRDHNVALPTPVEAGGNTPVHVAVDGRFAGVIFIADTLRPGAREALATESQRRQAHPNADRRQRRDGAGGGGGARPADVAQPAVTTGGPVRPRDAWVPTSRAR